MAFEQRPNSGAAFRNEKHTDGDKLPDLKGDALMECPHCKRTFGVWVSIWGKVSAKAGKWASLAFTPKQPRPEASEQAGNANDSRDVATAAGDDNLPF